MTNNIRYYLDLYGVSQQTFADYVGVARETISRLVNNRYNPSLKLAYDIACYFNVTIDVLFNFEV